MAAMLRRAGRLTGGGWSGKRACVMSSVWVSEIVRRTRPARRSHSRVARPKPAATTAPARSASADANARPPPAKLCAAAAGARMSHSRTVLSDEALSRMFGSPRRKRASWTSPECPPSCGRRKRCRPTVTYEWTTASNKQQHTIHESGHLGHTGKCVVIVKLDQVARTACGDCDQACSTEGNIKYIW